MRPSNPVLACTLAGLLFSSYLVADHDTEEALNERLAPEGQLNIVEPGSEPAPAAVESTAAAPEDGESVYNTACLACHGAGVAGAPKLGDEADWAPRLAQGMDTLIDHAINGFQGSAGVMPPKGGNAALSDTAVSNAVEFMVAQSGGEAAGGAAATDTAGEEAGQAEEAAEESSMTAEPASEEASAAMAAIDGAAIYNRSCMACHASGVAGAPKVGDTAAWTDRIAQGADVLYDHAINGFQGSAGVMIAKGGNAALSDDEVRAAVDHMVEQSQ